MKTRTRYVLILGVLLSSHQEMAAQSGATSSSAHYTLLHAPPGNAGGGGSAANVAGTVAADISLGDAGSGTPGEVSPFGVQAKPNFIGQLYDATALAVFAIPATVAEQATRQLSARATLDDATTLSLIPDQVEWSEASAALTGISSAGLATAAAVYQHEVATVHGIYQGLADPDGFNLNILNTGDDDFETYAADGIDDNWQVNWFGQPPNADAAPSADPDFDQQNNQFEFLSGFSPIDPLACFALTVVAVDRVAGTADLQLNRVIPNRVYTLMTSPDLVTPFSRIGNLPVLAEPRTDVIIRDTSATSPRNFYRIGISKP
ncbi:hypothetical protein HQ447_09645 [bacterium]|nr:hypothetical protein [bacterium]